MEYAVMPYNIEAEEAVIGSLLIDGDSITKVLPFLYPEDFCREKNGWVYTACKSLHQRSEPIDQLTVAHELACMKRLEAVGGAAYLSHLVSIVPTSVYIKHYGEIVKRLSWYRSLIQAGQEIEAIGYEANGDTNEALEKALQKLLPLRLLGQHSLLNPQERAEHALQTIVDRREGKSDALPFGFRDLDEITGGLRKGELTIMGARPGLGKSTFLQQVGLSLTSLGRVVLFCSAEMTSVQFTDRELASSTGLPMWKLVKGALEDADWDGFQEVIAGIDTRPLYFLGGMRLTTTEVESRAREVQIENGLDCLMLDYIQLLGDKYGNNNNERVGFISQRLKQLAVVLDVPILAASQLNRELETRAQKRPVLSDLRDSGSLEQDADMVLLLHRDDAYYTESDWKVNSKRREYPKGILEIGVAKHRQWGSRNSVIKLRWDEVKRQYKDYSG